MNKMCPIIIVNAIHIRDKEQEELKEVDVKLLVIVDMILTMVIKLNFTK